MSKAKSKTVIKGAALQAREAAGAPKRNKPKSLIIVGPAKVDLDKAFSCITPTAELRERATIPLMPTMVDGVQKEAAPHVAGVFAVLKKKNGKVTVERHVVKDTAGLLKMMESEGWRRGKLLETSAFSTGGNDFSPGGALPPNNEFIPLLGGPLNKQLYQFDYLDMHAKCFEAKNHNPLAKQIVDVLTTFTIGKGVKVMFKAPELQKSWDEFERRNDFQNFLRTDCDTLTWAGELMTHWEHFSDGMPSLKHIDPSTVWEIVTEPTDITVVYYYHQQFPTQWQLVYKGNDKVSEYVVNDLDAKDVIHVKINVAPGEKRGRSELFPVLGWLKLFKDYTIAKVTKAQIEESWAIKKKVMGSEADVEALFNDPTISQVPPPGSVLIENEAIETSYMTPTSSSTNGQDNVGEALVATIATGVGLPAEWLGAHGSAQARATAVVKSEPAARKIEDRQMLMERYARVIVDRWKAEGMVGAKAFKLPKTQIRKASLGKLQQALKARDFKKVIFEAGALLVAAVGFTEPIDQAYEVIFPEVSTDDRSIKLKDVATTQALGYISKERAATMSAKELGITDYNYDEEQETIRAEREENAADDLYNAAAGDAAAAGMNKGAGQGGLQDERRKAQAEDK